jgi:hypothetical protein
LNVPIIGDLTLLNVLLIAIGLVIVWIIVTIPMYIAGKVVTAGKSTMGDAMMATMFGPITYAATLFIAGLLLGKVVGTGAYIWALIVAFIVWILVFKASFHTSWVRTLALALLSILVFIGISILYFRLLGIVVPTPFLS